MFDFKMELGAALVHGGFQEVVIQPKDGGAVEVYGYDPAGRYRRAVLHEPDWRVELATLIPFPKEEPMPKPAPLIYYGSGGPQLVEDMHLAHLENAIRKVARLGESDAQNFPNLEAMRAVYDRRKAAWDAEHPAQ